MFNFIILLVICSEQMSQALYFKPNTDPTKDLTTIDHNRDEWTMFKQALGLSNEKVTLLKAQKDQTRIKQLLYQYMRDNPSYNESKKKPLEDFQIIFDNLIQSLKLSKQMLRTSLQLELMDKRKRKERNGHRKISIKVTADMPADQIDQLLKVFNKTTTRT